MWRRWDDRLYASLVVSWAALVASWAGLVSLRAASVAFWRVLFAPRLLAPRPAPRVLVSVGAGSASPELQGELLAPPEPPPTSGWAARPSHSKAWLACVLLGELQAGVMLRAVWEVVVRT